jgi:hypothetical protein
MLEIDPGFTISGRISRGGQTTLKLLVGLLKAGVRLGPRARRKSRWDRTQFAAIHEAGNGLGCVRTQKVEARRE